ncbi:4Fe-4S dicluster domain-containing protein [Ructibacterium gallinarum]|uniref:4Fe-4S dicluster domain-containing protein n=1 Tax=Ructibacterium gallinarum TaxID=2779355 RepID=A0A9D5LWV2_9FIRM|nr:4Fe-4S dicluster domain-containing protein [Ructibacterium gallinarum]MBE5039243.1 4Fe-4S dicluster domain-containing protein [Ructibacterium gallinarum]
MTIKKFDTQVQYLEYKVLREVARHAWDDTLVGSFDAIAGNIVGDKPTMRCCIYKERAIVAQRIDMASGGHKDNPNVIEVLNIACDGCPVGGYQVTDNCRGCIAHRCEDACKKGAITFDENQKAHIDKEKCVNCGMCAKVCPYSAIKDYQRPCVEACKIGAIGMNEYDKSAKIDNEKCIACGACVYQCPFGAIMDKSYILEVIDMIKKSENNTKYKVYAVIAPSIASQFTYDSSLKLGQVVSGIKALGFHSVVEAALGADMVAYNEAAELAEKGFLTSSCCPAFVSYVQKAFPQLKENVSHNLSPMATISKKIKEMDPEGKVVFIGPCTAKKMEIRLDTVKPYVDSALTFAELQALIDSRNIDMTSLEESPLDNASYYGRIFARCGGLADAVAEALLEQGVTDFQLEGISCDGIEECRMALLKASKGVLKANFIEGMACVGGCIGGAGCLTHGPKNKLEIDKYGKEAKEKSIEDAIKHFR